MHFQSTKVYFQSTRDTFKVPNSTFKVTKHTFELQKYTFKVQKHTFKVQSHFRNLGIGISGTRNLLNTSGSRTPGSRTGSVQTSGMEPNPSNPSNTETFETSRTQPAEPGTLAIPRVRNPVSPEPVPRTRFLPRTTPILRKDPIAFCCWGKIQQPRSQAKPCCEEVRFQLQIKQENHRLKTTQLVPRVSTQVFTKGVFVHTWNQFHGRWMWAFLEF